MDENGNSQRPFARACIRGGRVTLNPWNPRMIRGGPMAMHMRRVRAALVDLFVVEETELIAEPVSRSRFEPEHIEALVAWARSVGYSRIWLPDEVLDLRGEPAGGTARVLCRSCGVRWEDESTASGCRCGSRATSPATAPPAAARCPSGRYPNPTQATASPSAPRSRCSSN